MVFIYGRADGPNKNSELNKFQGCEYILQHIFYLLIFKAVSLFIMLL